MAFHPKKFTEQTGLPLARKTTVFYGDYRGYPVFLHWEPQKGYLIFTLHGALPEERDLTQTLTEWQTSHPGIGNLTYTGNSLVALITFSPKMTDENAVENLSALVELARELGLQPCCVECGTTVGFDRYLVNGKGYTFCGGCASRVGEALSAQQETKSQQRSNPLGVLLGTICGAVVLFLVTYLLWQAGFVAYITGYLGAIVTFMLIKKFSGKVSLSGVLFGSAVCLAVSFLTPCFCLANDMAKAFSDSAHEMKDYQDVYPQVRQALDTMSDEELTLCFDGMTRKELEDSYRQGTAVVDMVLSHTTAWSCFRDLPELLSDNAISDMSDNTSMFSDAKRELIKNILWGVLSILIGVALTAPAMLREGSGKFDLRRLED